MDDPDPQAEEHRAASAMDPNRQSEDCSRALDARIPQGELVVLEDLKNAAIHNYELGKYTIAAELFGRFFQRVRACDEASLEDLRWAAMAYAAAQDSQRAAMYFNVYISRAGVDVTLEVLEEAAMLNIYARNYRQAGELRERILLEKTEDEKTADDYRNAAMANFRVGNFAKSAAYFNVIFEGFGEEANADDYLNAALANFRVRKYDRAAEYFDVFLTREGNEATLKELKAAAKAFEVVGDSTREAALLLEIDRRAARSAFSIGSYAIAAVSYDKLFDRLRKEKKEASEDDLRKAAESTFRVGDFAKSAAYFNVLLEQIGDEASAEDLKCAARANFQVYDYHKSAAYFNVFLEKVGEGAWVDDIRKAALANFRVRDYVKSAQHFDVFFRTKRSGTTLEELKVAAQAFDAVGQSTRAAALAAEYYRKAMKDAVDKQNHELAVRLSEDVLRLAGREATLHDFRTATALNFLAQNPERALLLAEDVLRLAGREATLHDYRTATALNLLVQNYARASTLSEDLLQLAGGGAAMNDFIYAARAHLGAEKYAGAAVLAEEVLREKAELATLAEYRLAAECHFKAENYPHAAILFDEIICRFAAEATEKDLIDAAESYYRAKNYSRAAELRMIILQMSKSILQKPQPNKTAKNFRNAAEAYYRARNYEQAARLFDEGIRIDPNAATAQDLRFAATSCFVAADFSKSAQYWQAWRSKVEFCHEPYPFVAFHCDLKRYCEERRIALLESGFSDDEKRIYQEIMGLDPNAEYDGRILRSRSDILNDLGALLSQDGYQDPKSSKFVAALHQLDFMFAAQEGNEDLRNMCRERLGW